MSERDVGTLVSHPAELLERLSTESAEDLRQSINAAIEGWGAWMESYRELCERVSFAVRSRAQHLGLAAEREWQDSLTNETAAAAKRLQVSTVAELKSLCRLVSWLSTDVWENPTENAIALDVRDHPDLVATGAPCYQLIKDGMTPELERMLPSLHWTTASRSKSTRDLAMEFVEVIWGVLADLPGDTPLEPAEQKLQSLRDLRKEIRGVIAWCRWQEPSEGPEYDSQHTNETGRDADMFVPEEVVIPEDDEQGERSPVQIRNDTFLKWYEAKGEPTYQSPAKIRDRWNREHPDERIDTQKNENGRGLVKKAIKEAMKRRCELQKT